MGCKNKTKQSTNPKTCPSSNHFVRTVAMPSDPAQTPVRPVSIPSLILTICAQFRFWAYVLSKQFKILKSLGTGHPSSGYTVPWNQRQERSTGGVLLLPQFPRALLGPKAATYSDTFQTFPASPLSSSDLVFEILYQKHSTAKWSTLLLGGWVRF